MIAVEHLVEYKCTKCNKIVKSPKNSLTLKAKKCANCLYD